MKKHILFVICIMVLAAGCQEETGSQPGKGKVFIGGTNGMGIEFVEGSPPAEVYDGGNQPFDVVLKVENKGEFDVPKDKMKITISGVDPAQFGNPAIEKTLEEDVKGAYINPDGNTVNGGITYVTFSGFNYMESLTGNTPFKIRADACYAYGTKAQFMMCVRKDLTTISKGVCVVNEAKTIQSSSAPVQVANLKEDIAGTGKIAFSFDVSQKGTGIIGKQGSNCEDNVNSKDKVYVKVETGLTGLKCSGLSDGGDTDGYVTLYSGSRIVRCTQEVSGVNSDFEKPVTIELNYDYKEFVETNLLIKHSAG